MPYKDREKAAAHRKAYQRGWYQQNKDKILEKRFHHRDREEKSFTISNAVLRGTSIKTILIEIKKCDVLCENCHAKLHWRETHGNDNWEEVLPPVE
jgi:hypothetical protein